MPTFRSRSECRSSRREAQRPPLSPDQDQVPPDTDRMASPLASDATAVVAAVRRQHNRFRPPIPRMVRSTADGPAIPGGRRLVVRDPGGIGRWLVVRTWVAEADTTSEARAAAASERGWPLTETVASLATEPPAAMSVSRPGRRARSTDFCPWLTSFWTRRMAESRSRHVGRR